MTWQTTSTASDDTSRLGELLGNKLAGGEVIELAADLGGGKTTFTKGLVKGLGSQDNATSPTFTLSKIYKCRGGLEVHHFDFYRLDEPGIIADQLAESVNDGKVVTVVEWSDIVNDVLPQNRITISFSSTPNDPDERQIIFSYSENFAGLIRAVETEWEEVKP
ncbi:MAG TPA: tRNA (adenosine(37)-N6)-threonylcarbamoyltransferase complex ATPase subunit type 1 TsaE [Candidatus Saccharimonadales bacterium]|nr:tRNA (adenosine(37)-N6)-threonylcarbamoyltransferase complex ATPase subunit type 1 TsaE [Candidatus Saccharimonadales bacterium]